MSGVDGIEATRWLVAAGARARVLILTTFDLDEYTLTVRARGRAGSCLRTSPPRTS
jgi:DNA-binding NarL/FixJ family response regulator